ncbi:MAG: molecular chaperone TorD family protein [Coriobacteriales bacterium]|nr:molecular chaperone TorD family protein [Coriobacteriales bacterium]
MIQPTSQQEWLNRAALYELLAFGLRVPTTELGEAVSSGEFAEALEELGPLNGLDDAVIARESALLADYQGQEVEALFHRLRVEYTRLFVGAPDPKVSPFAGVWWAKDQGVEPLLFVNKRSMGVERYLRAVGVGRPEGTNEPLDNIATMLEFLQYAALVCAGAVEAPKGVEIDAATSERFIEDFLDDWMKRFAAQVVEETREPYYRVLAKVLGLL